MHILDKLKSFVNEHGIEAIFIYLPEICSAYAKASKEDGNLANKRYWELENQTLKEVYEIYREKRFGTYKS